MVLDEKRIVINTHPPKHLAIFHSRAENLGKPLDIAIVIGVEPALAIASQIRAPLGVDEAALAGGIRGQPVEFVRCLTVDVEVPSTSEIVIEGKPLPNARENEGPLAEYTGYYGPGTLSPVMEVTAITMRENPIYQTMLTGKPITENHLIKQIPLEASLYDHLRKITPNVKAVHFTPGGGCQNHAVIAIKQTYPGEAKTVIYAAFSSNTYLKHVVVVDDDIDIFNPVEVEWAIAFRFQSTKDLYVFPEVVGGVLDPSAPEVEEGVITAGMGIDATKPFGKPFAETAEIPKED
jgi:2,5-furandicarboxylate decarboxylase 1